MSEKQIGTPEVNAMTAKDLYRQCVVAFNLFAESATITPSNSDTSTELREQVELHTTTGNRVVLGWERPAKKDDPTIIDTAFPLEYYDESGKNQWHTPISITMYNEATGFEIHDYTLARAGLTKESEPYSFLAVDRHHDPAFPPSEGGIDIPMTALSANELIALMEHVFETAY